MSLAIYHDPYARGIPSLRGTSVKSPAETSSYQHLVPSPTIVPNICRWTPKSKQVSPTSTEHREKHFDHMDKQKNLAFPWSFANDCQFNVMSPVFLTSLFSLDVWCIMDLHVFAMNLLRMPTWLPNAQTPKAANGFDRAVDWDWEVRYVHETLGIHETLRQLQLWKS